MIFAIIVTAIALFSQTVLLPLNLAILSLMFWATWVPERYWPLVAFFLGLSFDLLTAQPLGLSSTLFLGIMLFCWFYSRKWQITNPLFLFFVAFVGNWLSRLVWGLDNSYFENLFVGLLAALWGLWRQRVEEPVRVKLRT